MRIRAGAAVVAAVVCLATAGCGPRNSATGGATQAGPGASSGSSAAASGRATGVASSCIVGSWRAVSVTMTFGAGRATGNANGGAGLLVTIGTDGRIVVDFDPMQPVSFTMSAGGQQVSGAFTYGGKATGVLEVPAGATVTGTWKPAGVSDWASVTITIDLVSPTHSRIMDHVRLADFGGASTSPSGGAVDAQPILREAAYECSGDTMTLHPPASSVASGAWTLRRA